MKFYIKKRNSMFSSKINTGYILKDCMTVCLVSDFLNAKAISGLLMMFAKINTNVYFVFRQMNQLLLVLLLLLLLLLLLICFLICNFQSLLYNKSNPCQRVKTDHWNLKNTLTNQNESTKNTQHHTHACTHTTHYLPKPYIIIIHKIVIFLYTIYHVNNR